MAGVYIILVILTLILHSAFAGQNKTCERPELENGCAIMAAHAQCEGWNFAESVRTLPSCVTRLTFSLSPNPQTVNETRITYVDVWDRALIGLSELQELNIIADKKSYPYFSADLNNASTSSILRLQKLHTLRMNVHQSLSMFFQLRGIYQGLKELQVLDLTRSKKLGLNSVSFLLGENPTVKTLILRNVQQFNQFTYLPNVDLSHFACGGHVTYLDLSYNDIINLVMNSKCSNFNLKHFIADNNLFAELFADADPKIAILPVIAKTESFQISVWSGEEYQEKLWQDDPYTSDVYIRSNKNLENPVKPSPLSLLLQHLPFLNKAYMGYDFWLEELMKECFDFGYFDMLRCSALNMTTTLNDFNICSFFCCLAPQLDIAECKQQKSDTHKFEYITTNLCPFKSCKYSFRTPLPPLMKSFVFQNAGTYGKYYFSSSNDAAGLQYPNKTLCLHPNNNLQVLDLRNIHFQREPDMPKEPVRLTGLHKLRYLNFQGHKDSFSFDSYLFLDAFSLTELHIGGGKVTQDDFLSTRVLRLYTQLNLLNLSSANLFGMDPDVFQTHKNLSVLDLSYNRLTSDSLASVDFSQTQLRSLNLSHNQLSTLAASMRDQLDHMAGLVIYLSGNGFICNCDNLDFLQWIQSSSHIVFHYAGDHVCTDSPGNTIHNIEIDSLHCDWFWVQPVLAVGCTLVVSLLCLAIYALYKKRWAIANFIFRLRERFCMALNDDSERGRSYTYDAFVLYSSKDEDRLWVHLKLVPELEKVYGFRVCIHHRDFLAGCDIVDNIETAIRRSRKVLVVMSPNFLGSNWCIEEVQMTVNFDRRKLIVLMYRDVLMSGVPIPPLLQRVLQPVYIEWDEREEAQKLFWKKMRRALYSKHMTYLEETRPAILLPDDMVLDEI